jgi:uncharacterized spore protein YtfJ
MGLDENQALGQKGELVQHLADRLSATASARTVFGDPVARNGATIIPVASVRYGFGGGGGRRRDQNQEGAGGGGGVRVSPVGYIEMTERGVAFRRIPSTSRLARAVAIAAGVSIAARGIAAAVLPLLTRWRLRSRVRATHSRRS